MSVALTKTNVRQVSMDVLFTPRASILSDLSPVNAILALSVMVLYVIMSMSVLSVLIHVITMLSAKIT